MLEEKACQSLNENPAVIIAFYFGALMSHIIQKEKNQDSRNNYLQFIALTINELKEKTELDMETKDMVAFIMLLLKEIQKNINKTAQAWEKRDYWLKADQFKREWQWSKDQINLLSKALKENDNVLLKNSLIILFEKTQNIKIPNKIFYTSPWNGAYDRIKKELQ